MMLGFHIIEEERIYICVWVCVNLLQKQKEQKEVETKQFQSDDAQRREKNLSDPRRDVFLSLNWPEEYLYFLCLIFCFFLLQREQNSYKGA